MSSIPTMKRDFETAFPNAPTPPQKKDRRSEPDVVVLHDSPIPLPFALAVFPTFTPSPTLQDRITLPASELTRSQMQHLAQADYKSGIQHSRENKERALSFFNRAAKIYVQIGEKKPPYLILKQSSILFELGRYHESIVNNFELSLDPEREPSYRIAIQVNAILCQLCAENWPSFSQEIDLFISNWLEWFLFNPSSCPLLPEDLEKTISYVRDTEAFLEKLLELTGSDVRKKNIHKALVVLAYANQDYEKALVYARILKRKSLEYLFRMLIGTSAEQNNVYRILDSLDIHLPPNKIKHLVNDGLKTEDPRILKLAVSYLQSLDPTLFVLNDLFFCHLALNETQQAQYYAGLIDLSFPGLTATHHALCFLDRKGHLDPLRTHCVQNSIANRDYLLHNPNILKFIARRIHAKTQNPFQPEAMMFTLWAQSFHRIFYQ